MESSDILVDVYEVFNVKLPVTTTIILPLLKVFEREIVLASKWQEKSDLNAMNVAEL